MPATLGRDKHNNAIQALTPGTSQTVAYTGTSARTANALGVNTIIVRLISTTACFVRFGTGNPTAVTTDMYLPAGIPEYFTVNGEQTIKIAAIRLTDDGNLYVTEMA